jgi:hypothetical protein
VQRRCRGGHPRDLPVRNPVLLTALALPDSSCLLRGTWYAARTVSAYQGREVGRMNVGLRVGMILVIILAILMI